MKRRLVTYFEQEMHAEIDERKIATELPDLGTVKIQNDLRNRVIQGDLSIRGVLEWLCHPGTLDQYAHLDVEFVIEEECPKHPGTFVRAVPAEKCHRCGEERMAKVKTR